MGPLISDRAAAMAVLAGAKAGPGKAVRWDSIDGLSEAFVSPGMATSPASTRAGRGAVRAAAAGASGGERSTSAIAAANATRYGSVGGLISNESARWDHFLNRIRAGVVNWNRPTTGAAGTHAVRRPRGLGQPPAQRLLCGRLLRLSGSQLSRRRRDRYPGDIKGLRE
jgi:succinylglutamic semialdehyde dehydrogenase